MPSKANMKMNKKRRKRRDMIEEMAFISAITRFLRDDQYLKHRQTEELDSSLAQHFKK
jgi:hypothetical protein